MNSQISASGIRQALAELPRQESIHSPSLEHIYISKSHVRALQPDSILVTGMRGAGKTFWWSTLRNDDARELLGQSYGSLLSNNSLFDSPLLYNPLLLKETEVQAGFGGVADDNSYPSKRALKNLLNKGIEPQDIWRTILARRIAPDGNSIPGKDWLERAQFVVNNIETIDRMFEYQDSQLDQRNINFLMLFDALDRCADDWNTTYALIRGLLQEALLGRSYKRIYMKIFLRSDQFEEGRVFDFPDASKILKSKVELSWPPHQLYALLWHHLGNSKINGAQFREFLHDEEWKCSKIDRSSVFLVPHDLIFNPDIQRKKFNTIASQWMGAGPKRGRPYTWIPSHLGDTNGKVSPRSFLAALRAAAENTGNSHPNYDYALHYDSIKFGVQEASTIRKNEIREDYPWVDKMLEPLSGKSVPCDFADITKCWKKNNIINNLTHEIEKEEVKLPPVHINEGPEGVRRDIESLGIFQRMRDGRVNIPDVVRVAYGLGRKGGVKPVR